MVHGDSVFSGTGNDLPVSGVNRIQSGKTGRETSGATIGYWGPNGGLLSCSSVYAGEAGGAPRAPGRTSCRRVGPLGGPIGQSLTLGGNGRLHVRSNISVRTEKCFWYWQSEPVSDGSLAIRNRPHCSCDWRSTPMFAASRPVLAMATRLTFRHRGEMKLRGDEELLRRGSNGFADQVLKPIAIFFTTFDLPMTTSSAF